MFKTELHLHTSPASNCAHVSSEDAIEQYIKEGYDTVVITNHMSPTLFNAVIPKGMTEWRDIADVFLDDYRRAKKQAGDRLNVLLGMEVRVKANMNDYLVYGVDEQFVYDMGNIMDYDIKMLSEFIHENGGLIYQAHPFRNTMTVTNPKYLDGIEVYNLSPGHDSRNDIACLWAEKFNLKKICGTDYHKENHMCGAGILTDTEIKDNDTLVQILKEEKYTMKTV